MRSALALAWLLALASASAAAEVTPQDVEKELSEMKGPHPWAGTYNGPGGFSYDFLQLAPSGKFCALTFFDAGGSTSGNCGRLRLEGDRFVTDGRPQGWEERALNGPPYLRVPWGGRNYLVPERRIIDFINDVNGVKEPRYRTMLSGSLAAFIRGREVEIPVTGAPTVPEKYRPFILKTPLTAVTLETAERTQIITRHGAIELEDCGTDARFDLGSSSGAFVGMELHAQSGDQMAEVRLATVTADSSWGRITQNDCDSEDPLPTRTVFSTRPAWRRNVVLSTEPLHIGVRFPSPKRYAPFFDGQPFTFFGRDAAEAFAGSRAAGFDWTEVGELNLSGSDREALQTDGAMARRERAILSIGGNAVLDPMERQDLKSEDAGGLVKETVKVYRLSYQGRALDPATEISLAFHLKKHHRGEKSGYDWTRAVAGVRSTECRMNVAAREAMRQAGLRLLRWDNAILARAYDLRFEDLGPEQRAAAEALVPEDLRRGHVWPALVDKRSEFHPTLWKVGWDVERGFKKSDPATEAECQRLKDDVMRHLSD